MPPHDPPYTAAEIVADLQHRGVIPARRAPAPGLIRASFARLPLGLRCIVVLYGAAVLLLVAVTFALLRPAWRRTPPAGAPPRAGRPPPVKVLPGA